jgi:hypothetical protein
MRYAACALVILALVGCASSAQIRVSSELLPPPGIPASGGHVGIDLRTGSGGRALAVAAALGVLFGASQERSDRSYGMMEGRDINAQDCTQPIERPGANLFCK